MQPPPSLSEKPAVFVSHSGHDAWVAQRIAYAIRNQGAEAFLYEELEVGDRFPDEVFSAIRRGNELVAYLTPWALDSAWVWLEIGAALGQGQRIVCVLHGVSAGELRENSGFPIEIATRNFVAINDFDSRYGKQLRRRVRQANLDAKHADTTRAKA